MPIQFVGSKTFGHNNVAAQNCSLTDLAGGLAAAPAENDVVVIAYSHANVTSDARTLAQGTPAGYTNLHAAVLNPGAESNSLSFVASAKLMGAVPDTTVSVPAASAATSNVHCTISVWRGVDFATITTTAATTATAINTGLPDPASIATPAISGCVILGMGGGSYANATATAIANAGATPYDAVTTGNYGTGTGSRAASIIGRKTGVAASTAFNGIFSGGVTANTASWAAVSIVMRPKTHAFTTASVATSSPQLGTIISSQRHAVTATTVATAAPASTSPAISQAHALAPGKQPGPELNANPGFDSPSGYTVSGDGAINGGVGRWGRTAGPGADGIQYAPGVADPIGRSFRIAVTGVTIAEWGQLWVGYPGNGPAYVQQGLANGANSFDFTATVNSGIVASFLHSNPGTGAFSEVDGLSFRELIPGVFTSAPSLAMPTAANVAPATPLTSTGMSTSAPAVATPVLVRVVALASSAVSTAGPAFTTAAITQGHAVSAVAVAPGVPSIQPGALGQTQALAPAAVAGGGPVVAAASLGQAHNLAAFVTEGPELVINGDGTAGLTGWNTTVGGDAVLSNVGGRIRVAVDSDGVNTTGATTAQDVFLTVGGRYRHRATIWASQFGRGRIQTYELGVIGVVGNGPTGIDLAFTSTVGVLDIALGAASGAAWADPGEFAEFDDISVRQLVSGLWTATPALAAPSIGQAHSLTSVALTAAVLSLHTPTLIGVIGLSSAGVLTASPSLFTATIAQAQVLSAGSAATAPPSLATSALTRVVALSATSTATAPPVLQVGIIGQVHGLTAAHSATAAPEVGLASVSSTAVLLALPVAAPFPVIDPAALVGVAALATGGLTTAAPVIGTAGIGQAHSLLSTSVAASAPAIGARSVAQGHSLAPVSLATGAAQTATAGLIGVVAFAPANAATAAPALASAALTRVLVMQAVGLATSAAQPSPASITGSPPLVAVPVASAAPGIAAATLAQVVGLAANAVYAAAPVLTAPVLKQSHKLTAVPVAGLAPVVALGAVGQAHVIAPAPLETAAPGLATAGSTVGVILVSAPVLTAPPLIGGLGFGMVPATPVERRTIGRPRARLTVSEARPDRGTASDPRPRASSSDARPRATASEARPYRATFSQPRIRATSSAAFPRESASLDRADES